MSDLIDLKSPETRSTKPSSKLPSPLIPAPNNVVLIDDSSTVGSLVANQLHQESRKSLDNNPFDMVIRKTSEYVSKSEDPFELVWEKAVTSSSSSTTPKKNINSSDDNDCHLLKKNHLKMSRYLSSGDTAFNLSDNKNNRAPSIYIEPPSPAGSLSILNQSAMNDSLQILSDKINNDDCIFDMGPSPEENQPICDLSILNQSAMNDDSLLTSAHQNLTDKIEPFVGKKPVNDRLHHLPRSLSQGDNCLQNKSSKNKSLVNDSNDIINNCILSTRIFDDPMNQAFLSSYRENSVFNDCSDISAISRMGSVSSSTGSYSYNSIANRGFLGSDGCSIDTTKSTNSMSSSISDLVLKFNHLKAKLSGAKYSDGSEYLGLDNLNLHAAAARPNDSQQLLDISSDSVFLKNDEGGKNNICNEAKHLVKTFEELASSSSTECSDEMLPNKIPNEPMLEIEIPTDNLIELSPTPVTKSTSGPNEPENQPSVCKNSIKDLETELLHPEKKLQATTLLMNLEQLVKSENNQKAIELLENLEKVLGIKCQSNSELLQLCLQEDSENSQKNKDTHLEGNEENSNESTKRLSCENNINIDEPKTCNKKSIIITETNELNKSKTDEKMSNLNNEKLVLDLKEALNKLLTSVDGEPVKLLENLNKVLNSEGQDSPQVKLPASPRKSGLPYRSVKSLSHHQSIDSSMKKRQLDRPLKRQSLLGHSIDTPKRSEPRSRIDSPKKSLIKRISSDPVDKKLPETVMKMRTSMPVMDKAKLRKKCEDIPVIKKGPLKAVMPLGSMQRGGSIGKKLTSVSTPPRLPRKISAVSKLVTSTPDRNPAMSIICVKKSPKKKPVASSTPGPVEAKLSKAKIQVPQSPRGNNMSWNISPVTPTAPSTPFSGTGRKLPPSKLAMASSRVGTPRKLERSLSSAMIQLNSPKGLSKVASRNSVVSKCASPLKDNNGPGKIKNLSKLRRHSSSVGAQKENKLN